MGSYRSPSDKESSSLVVQLFFEKCLSKNSFHSQRNCFGLQKVTRIIINDRNFPNTFNIAKPTQLYFQRHLRKSLKKNVCIQFLSWNTKLFGNEISEDIHTKYPP